jgi:hypothetical protein
LLTALAVTLHDEWAVAELLEAPDGTQEEQSQKALDMIFGAERLVSAKPLEALGELYGGNSRFKESRPSVTS